MTYLKMKCISLIFGILLGNASFIKAGLLDTLGNIFGGTNDQSPYRPNPRYPINFNNDIFTPILNNNIGDQPQQPPLWNTPNNIKPNNIDRFVTKKAEEDQDKAVAEAFPQGVALLNTLKELNRLKDEGKLNIGLSGINNNSLTMPSIVVPPVIADNEKPASPSPQERQPVDNNTPKPRQSVKVETPVNVNNTTETNISAGSGYFFQAQPVMPED